MLIKNYTPKVHKILNNSDIQHQLQSKPTLQSKQHSTSYIEIYQTLKYPTKPIDEVFSSMDSETFNNLHQEQIKAAEKEANILAKYNFLTETTKNKTIKQYKNFFFYDSYAYPVALIKDYIIRDENQDLTFLQKPQQQNPTHEQNEQKIPRQYKISRQAIRNITEFTTSPIPMWAYKAPYNTPEYQKPIKIQWQHDLLEDDADVIVVDGSRQIWKSKTIAERAIEESFIPENDTLVWAFLAKTTNVIRNYILSWVRKFPEGTFIHYKSEGYIINTTSNTKVYFRTLADDAQNVLGLTLYNIIIDEAQLVDDDVFENALLPTLTTTWWRLILIWTPWKKQKWYYFKKMIEAKKQQENPELSKFERISLYRVTIDKNPLVHPRTRARIMEKIDDPAIQRQYFCNWSSWSDNLFQPVKINNFPQINRVWYLVLWIDPARLADRSWYSLNYVFNNKVTTIISWEVPKNFKKKWELQALFYKKMIEKYKTMVNNNNFIIVMDIWWVWDAVLDIFKLNWVPVNIWIRYTTWFNPETKTQNWKIPKSQMINTKLDFISEEIYQIFEPANKDLIEELDYIYEEMLRNWQIAMISTFFDDITNANLISLTVIKERNLISRAIWADEAALLQNTVESYFFWMENPNQKARLKNQKNKSKSVW